MKLLIIMLSALFSMSLLADSRVIIEIDGVEHSCRPTRDSGNQGSIIECINLAYTGPFTRSESEQICRGGRGTAPAACALKAYSGPYTRSECISLCQGARSEGPVECATLAYSGPFTRSETIELCSGRGADRLTAECALEAYRGPYTRTQSIELCKGRKNNKMNFRSKEMVSELVKEANLKAFSLGEYK